MTNYSDWLKTIYGIEALDLGEEIGLPENMKSTRRCKMEIVDMCSHMISEIEQIRSRAKQIPVEDSDRHAEMVRRLRFKVKSASLAIEKACFYNGGDVI